MHRAPPGSAGNGGSGFKGFYKGLGSNRHASLKRRVLLTYLLTPAPAARAAARCGPAARVRGPCARSEIVTPSRTGSFFSLLWALRGEIRGVRACSRAVIHCVSKPTGPCRLPEVLYLTPE